MDFDAPAADHAAEALQVLKQRLQRKRSGHPWKGPPSVRQLAGRYVRQHFVGRQLGMAAAAARRANTDRVEDAIVQQLAFVAEAVEESPGLRCYAGWRRVLQELDVPHGGHLP